MESYVWKVRESAFHKMRHILNVFCTFNFQRRFQTNIGDVYIILVKSGVTELLIIRDSHYFSGFDVL